MARTTAVYLGDGRVITRTANGFKLIVDARDVSIAPHLIIDGVWEEWTEAVLRRLVRPGMHVLEIGANVGYFSLVMARAVGATGSVWSFECDPRLAQLVRENAEINGLPRTIRVDERAVSDTVGPLTFHTAERHRGGGTLVGGLQQLPELGEGERRELTVDATTVDALLRERGDPRIDLVKIDAEGAEPAIVRGGASLFADRDRPLVAIIEFFPAFLATTGDDPAEYLRRFEAWGFRLHRIDERRRRLERAHPRDLLERHASEMVLIRTGRCRR